MAIVQIVERFAARYQRRCDRCDRRIRQGHLVIRLTSGEQICLACVKAGRIVGWRRERR